MTCTPPIRTITSGVRVPVYSTGGTAPGTSDIHVMWPDELIEVAPLIKGVRATIIVENATENFDCKAVFQATEDGCTWETAIGLESQMGSGNRKATTSWYVTLDNFKRGIRLGVIAEQSAGRGRSAIP